MAHQLPSGWRPVTYDEYESKIMSLLRQDPARTYAVEQIRLEVVGSTLSWLQKGYTPLHTDYAYREMGKALRRLIQIGEVREKEDGSGRTVYGLRMSRTEAAKYRIDKSGAWRSVRHFEVSLDRRVKGVDKNWLAVCSIVVAIAAIVAAVTIAVLA